MTDNSVHFNRNGKQINFSEGKSYKDIKSKQFKDLKPIFDEIDKIGDKKGKVDGKELELIKLLREKLGEGYITEDSMKKIVEDFNNSGKSIEVFLKEYNPTSKADSSANTTSNSAAGSPAYTATNSAADDVTLGVSSPDPSGMIRDALEEGTVDVANKTDSEPVADKTTSAPAKQEKKAADGKTSLRAFNNTIQNMKQKYGDKKEALTTEFASTYTVKKGDSLYKIAVEQLKSENGGKKPTNAQINERIAEIALVNNINDVNNVKIGKELKVGRTQAPKHEEVVKAKGQNPQDVVKAEVEKSFEVVKPEIDSTWKEEAVEGETNIKKYTKTEGEGDNAVTATRYKYSASNISVEAKTLEELKELIKPFKSEIKTAPQNETEEAAATRKAENLKTLVERVKAYPSEEVLKDVVDKLKDKTLVDQSSDDLKALVKSLLLTKNVEVVTKIVTEDGDTGHMDNTLFTGDEEALQTVATMFNELVAKENAGEKLTDEEHVLKLNLSGKVGYSIPADTANGVVEKIETYCDRGIIYSAKGYWSDSAIGYWSDSAKLLDEFITKLKAADTDEKKAALFKEYANTEDVGLARALAIHADDLKASKEDVLELVNRNDMAVIYNLKYTPADDVAAEFNTAVKDKVLDIYLNSDVGNIENTQYLAAAFDKLEKAGLSGEDFNSAETKILETYFVVETTKDENGNEVKNYKFEPERRYTKDEMAGLINYGNNISEDMYNAIVDSVKIEDVGKHEYTSALEYLTHGLGYALVDKYAEFVDQMETKEEVLDFISNKISDFTQTLPYDKVLEKFPNDSDIMNRLVSVLQASTPREASITDENRVKIAKFYTETDSNGNVIFDKTKLPNGTGVNSFVSILPEDCSQGDAQKVANAIIAKLGKNDLDALKDIADKNAAAAVRKRLTQLVAENQTDKEFIQKILDSSRLREALPYDALMKLNAVGNEYDDKTKQALFENVIYGHDNMAKDREQLLAKAVEMGWAEKLNNNYYKIGDIVYDIRWASNGNDGKFGTDDDIMHYVPMSAEGYKHGIAMYKQLKGAGSGHIADMLRGTVNEHVNYKDYVTKDSIVGVLSAFNEKSPKESIMEYIANEWGWSHGEKPKKDVCNNIPKALMQKAIELDLADTDEFKALKEFFGADDELNFTKNNDSDKRYKPNEGKQLDELINKLLLVVMNDMCSI